MTKIAHYFPQPTTIRPRSSCRIGELPLITVPRLLTVSKSHDNNTTCYKWIYHWCRCYDFVVTHYIHVSVTHEKYPTRKNEKRTLHAPLHDGTLPIQQARTLVEVCHDINLEFPETNEDLDDIMTLLTNFRCLLFVFCLFQKVTCWSNRCPCNLLLKFCAQV